MTQIRCGFLESKDKAGMRFRGRVTLEGRLDDTIVLRDHPRKKAPDEPGADSTPAFEIFIERNGRELPVGAAWLKNHENVGDFLSLTLDKVNWPRPLYLTAFPPKDERDSKWPVVWSRPRGQRVQDEEYPSGDMEDAA